MSAATHRSLSIPNEEIPLWLISKATLHDPPAHTSGLNNCLIPHLRPHWGGYATVSIDKKNRPAHRVIWEYRNGPIPDGLVIRHKCDVRNCINPIHMELGTQADNVKDRDMRGRHNPLKGEDTPQSKLTEQEVKEIRALAEDGYRHKYIAAMYDISKEAISAIKCRRVWKHI